MLENNVGVKTLLNRRERRLAMWHFWSCRTHYPNIYSDAKPMVFSWRQEGFLHSYKLLLRATFIDIYAIVMSGHLSELMTIVMSGHLSTFNSLSYRAITWEGCSIWGLNELSVTLMHYFFFLLFIYRCFYIRLDVTYDLYWYRQIDDREIGTQFSRSL